MKKFRVEYAEEVIFESTIIKAESEDEAREKYIEMLDNNKIETRETSQIDMTVEEVTE